MPSPHVVSAKLKSSPLRADTINGCAVEVSEQLPYVSGSGSPLGTISPPLRSVTPRASTRPVQLSLTCTLALATGLPLSSAVTQARLRSRPHLKCTAMLVTSAAVAT